MDDESWKLMHLLIGSDNDYTLASKVCKEAMEELNIRVWCATNAADSLDKAEQALFTQWLKERLMKKLITE